MSSMSTVLLGALLAIFFIVANSESHISSGYEECIHPILGASTGGLLDQVQNTQNTIGYAGLDSVQTRKAEEKEEDACKLKIAKIINKRGLVVEPSSEGAQASVRASAGSFANSVCPGFGLCADVYDAEDTDVWPISTLTYLLVPLNATDAEDGCDAMRTLYDYVKWILSDPLAADIARELSFATMPNVIADQALAILDGMTCTDANGVKAYVKDRATSSSSLVGSGSSLQGVLQSRLTSAYFQQKFVSISYTPTSSGTGRASLRAFESHFSGSDSILDMEDPEFIRRQIRMIPAFAAAVAVVYNVHNVEDLVLSRAAVNAMFTGEITSWDNAFIAQDNAALAPHLPREAILRVVRESKSGTTTSLTQALYAFAGLPTDPAALDYSLHPLGGSGLPEWPVPGVPFADGAACVRKGCIKSICEPGSHLSLELQRCVECEEGTFSDVSGQHLACSPCPPGSYTNTRGNAKCSKCDEQHFQDGEGAVHCRACPANTRRFFAERRIDTGDGGWVTVLEETPGIAAEECKCLQGFWLPASVNASALGGAACEACPDGAECAGWVDGRQQVPQPKQDFWGDPASPHRFVECMADACLPAYRCVDGHQGRLCAAPAPDYYTVAGRWYRECPAGAGERRGLVVVSFAVLFVVWGRLHGVANSNYDAVAVVLGVVQAFWLISKLRLRWHPALQDVMAAAGLLNFDVGFLGPHCLLADWDPAAVFYLQLALPAIFTAAAAGWYQVRWQVEGRTEASTRDKNIRSKGVLRSRHYLPDRLATHLFVHACSWVVTAYPVLALTAISPFVCEEEPGGQVSYMQLAPEIECGSGRHLAMRVTAIVYLPVVLGAVPVLLVRRVLQGHRQDLLNNYDFMEQFGFFYVKYRADTAYWEGVVLARKGLLALILSVVEFPMVQAVLTVALLNGCMCLHLVREPMLRGTSSLLEVFGLFCALVLAVCGMLFFPSLDKAVQCVGSGDLVGRFGDQCNVNSAVKLQVAVLLLALVALACLVSLAISLAELRSKVYGERAARLVKRNYESHEERMVGVVIDGSGGAGDAGGEEAAELREALGAQSDFLPEYSHTSCWRVLAARLGLVKAAVVTEREAEGDPYKLKLCHMVNGVYLHHWQASLSHAVSAANTESKWQRVRSAVGMHVEELAYQAVDEALSKFATIFDHVSGFYVNDDLGNLLRVLNHALPLLIDYLAHADAAHRRDFSAVVLSFTMYARRGKSRAFHDLVMIEHRTAVLHWLMRCSEEQRRSFRTVFTAIASASGLSKVKVANLGLKLAPAPAPDAFARLDSSDLLARGGSADLPRQLGWGDELDFSHQGQTVSNLPLSPLTGSPRSPRSLGSPASAMLKPAPTWPDPKPSSQPLLDPPPAGRRQSRPAFVAKEDSAGSGGGASESTPVTEISEDDTALLPVTALPLH